MKLVKTVKIKLNAEAAELLPTFTAYTKAFNYVAKIGFTKKKYHSFDLHKLTYNEVRSQFNLPSQLTCSVRNKASESLHALYKKHKKYTVCPTSNLCSIRLDKNSYSLFLDSRQVSLLTCDGRKRYQLILSDYSSNFFNTWKYTSADLCITKNKVYIHVVFEKDIADTPTNGTFVGLDRGISNIAVTSNNKFFSGQKVKQVVSRYGKLRSNLQQKGTQSAKRHLKRLSRKERRFRADINHQISKQIISSLNPGDTLVLEDLTGIRAKRLRKTVRTLVNNWSFFQLELFLTYKANAKGICITKVPAKYTSQTCSKCGHCARNNRKTRANFVCQGCGFRLNADLNASRNIRNKALAGYTPASGVVVNQPIVEAALPPFTSQRL